MTNERHAWMPFALASVTGFLAGCGPDEVRSYQAPKDPRAATHATPLATTAASVPPRIAWQVPSDWKELPGNQFRVGSFAVEDNAGRKAQVTIIPLGGTGGGDLANVNRWRQQVGQPPMAEDAMEKAAETVEIAGASGMLFDVAGLPPGAEQQTRILAAILHRPSATWYFKMTGDDALVSAQKPAFVEFLARIAFNAPKAGERAPSQPSTRPASLSAPARAMPEWTVPSSWKPAEPGQMQLARFQAGESAPAEVSVAVLPGAGGGVLANVNRWRRQLGLGPITEEALAELLVKPEGLAGYVVDIVSEQNDRRMVTAAVEGDSQTWFYKLSGEPAAVAREQAAFMAFVRSAKH